MRGPNRLFALVVLATACLPVAPAAALSYPVTSTADSGGETLRWAIEEANAHEGPDSIPIEAAGTIDLETALPTVADDVAITGPGAGALTVRRSAEAPFRIFNFGDGVTASLAGVTVADGLETTLAGGILVDNGSLTLTGVVLTGNEVVTTGGGSTAIVHGGGIVSFGDLTVNESEIRGNKAIAEGGSSATIAGGGGISLSGAGTLTVEGSTISGNLVQALGKGGLQVEAAGGGIRALGESSTVERSTVSGNSIEAAEGSSVKVAKGGGLQGIDLTLTSSTVTGNEISSEGAAAGANFELVGTSLVRNTIVSNPLGDAGSCGGPETSWGFNLDEDGSCDFGQATDLAGIVAGLDPQLKSNGGSTPTHALLATSPGIDRGNSFGSAIDQRGFPRPKDFSAIGNAEGGDGADIGAFELQVLPLGPVLVTTAPADTQPPNTRIVIAPPRVTFKRIAKFRFASTEPQSRFQCKFDGGRWQGCRNPYKRVVAAGEKHVFKVRAIDRFGNVDPTPARFGWRVKSLGG